MSPFGMAGSKRVACCLFEMPHLLFGVKKQATAVEHPQNIRFDASTQNDVLVVGGDGAGDEFNGQTPFACAMHELTTVYNLRRSQPSTHDTQVLQHQWCVASSCHLFQRSGLTRCSRAHFCTGTSEARKPGNK